MWESIALSINFLPLYSNLKIWPRFCLFLWLICKLSLENNIGEYIIPLSMFCYLSFLVGTNLNILFVIVLVVVLFFCGSITNELCKKPINNKLCSEKIYSMDDLHQFQSCIEFVWGDLASLEMPLPLLLDITAENTFRRASCFLRIYLKSKHLPV